MPSGGRPQGHRRSVCSGVKGGTPDLKEKDPHNANIVIPAEISAKKRAIIEAQTPRESEKMPRGKLMPFTPNGSEAKGLGEILTSRRLRTVVKAAGRSIRLHSNCSG